MQMILQFTILARISPTWNIVGQGLLMFGPYFILGATSAPAMKFEITVTGN